MSGSDSAIQCDEYAIALGRFVLQSAFVEHRIRVTYVWSFNLKGADLVREAFAPQLSQLRSKFVEQWRSITQAAPLANDLDFLMERFEVIQNFRNERVHGALEKRDDVWKTGYVARLKNQPIKPEIVWFDLIPQELEQKTSELESIYHDLVHLTKRAGLEPTNPRKPSWG